MSGIDDVARRRSRRSCSSCRSCSNIIRLSRAVPQTAAINTDGAAMMLPPCKIYLTRGMCEKASTTLGVSCASVGSGDGRPTRMTRPYAVLKLSNKIASLGLGAPLLRPSCDLGCLSRGFCKHDLYLFKHRGHGSHATNSAIKCNALQYRVLQIK